jgi:hypothetical protein
MSTISLRLSPSPTSALMTRRTTRSARVVFTHFAHGVSADKGALSTGRQNHALIFENPVRSGDGVAVYAEVTCQLAYRRQRGVGLERSCFHSFVDLSNDLLVDGLRSGRVNANLHRLFCHIYTYDKLVSSHRERLGHRGSSDSQRDVRRTSLPSWSR